MVLFASTFGVDVKGKRLGGEGGRCEDGKEGKGRKGVSRNTMGEIKEGRRYTVYNFVPSEVLVHLNFVPFVGVGIMRAYDDTYSGQHVLQTYATGDVADVPAIKACESTGTENRPYPRVVAGRHVTLAINDVQRQVRLNAAYERQRHG